MSKPNLLYYFRRKEDIYVAVLEKILADWLAPLESLDEAGEPIDEISPLCRGQDGNVAQQPQGLAAFRQRNPAMARRRSAAF